MELAEMDFGEVEKLKERRRVESNNALVLYNLE